MKRIALSNSTLLAIGLLGAVVLWMLSGIARDDNAPVAATAGPQRSSALPRVTVRTSRAQEITRE